MPHIGDVEKESGEAWEVTRNVMMVCSWLIGAVLAGTIGLGIGAAISAFILCSKPRKAREYEGLTINPLEIKKGDRIPKSNGVYRLNARMFDFPYHVGVGYIKDGVLHTRYHVTKGNLVEVDDIAYGPTCVNKEKDNIAYGGRPLITNVGMREEIVVALAGPNSNYILPYKTRAETDADGNMVFYGNRSMPGCSGSPIFRLVSAIQRDAEGKDTVITEYALVGTIGWFYDKKISDDKNGTADERKAIEIAPSDPQTDEYHVRFVPGAVTQVFKHPGSGKTRDVARDLIIDGIDRYGKVYFLGPTRRVCEEANNVLKEYFPDKVSLLTSSAITFERGSSHRLIVITAHATALNMLARRSIEVMKKGLWIMDEAHFLDSKTLVLKNYLRHKIIKEHAGSLVEMTATGYDINAQSYVIASGSNSEIEDITMSPGDMVHEIVRQSKDKKILVY